MEYNQAVDFMVNAEDAMMRRLAAESLYGEHELNSDTIELLVKGLTDDDDGVKDTCNTGLLRASNAFKPEIAHFVAPLITSRKIEIRNLASDLLIQLGEYSIDSLLPYLHHEDYQIKIFASDILGLIPSQQSVPFILELLDDPQENVKISAITTLGNLKASSAFENISQMFNNNEDLQLFIIEAIGKIGNEESQHFLINILRNESDLILLTAAIDALATSGEDTAICEYLLLELPDTAVEAQTILLKTIYAIAGRNNFEITLPGELRYIAQNALMEEDEDIRGAGLMALSNGFIVEDIPYLLNEIFQNNSEIQQYILMILLTRCNGITIDEFFKELFKSGMIQETVNFITQLTQIWDNIEDIELKQVVVGLILELIIKAEFMFANEIIEILLSLDSQTFTECLKILKTVDDDVMRSETEKFIGSYSLDYLLN